MAKMYGKGKKILGNINAIESEEQQRLRWQIELEFVQCLGNPNYLNYLAQRGYFKDQCFINYLKYLLYWKEPEYAKYIMYPVCLHLLDLLQYEHFRRQIVNAQCCKFIDEQVLLLWQHYTRKRTRMFESVNGQLTGSESVEQQHQQGANAPNMQNGVTNNIQSQGQQQLQQQQQQAQPQQQYNGIASGAVGASPMQKMQ